jgi:hypothetical protein
MLITYKFLVLVSFLLPDLEPRLLRFKKGFAGRKVCCDPLSLEGKFSSVPPSHDAFTGPKRLITERDTAFDTFQSLVFVREANEENRTALRDFALPKRIYLY